MSGNLRTRLSSRRVFLLSGFQEQERKDLAKKIHQLGGIYFDTESFKSNCTHVVCGKLSRSEKFLGACATGKWVLHPTYIHQSATSGEWLKEENYEWYLQINKNDGEVATMAEAPRRWRFQVEAFQKPAFGEWKAAVVVTGTKKNTVYKRLLSCGGAEVYNVKLPITKPEKVVGTLAYIFVNEKSAAHVYHLMEYGVLCLKPEFIGDYLIKDPLPDPFDYLISPPGSSTPCQSLDNSIELSQYIADSSQSTPVVQGSSQAGQNTTTPLSVYKLSPLSGIPDSGTSLGDKIIISTNTSLETQYFDGYSTDKENDVQNSDIPNVSTKRKLSVDMDIDVDNVLKEMKKQKITADRFVWRPTVLTLNNGLQSDKMTNKEAPMVLANSMTGMIHTCLEEDGSTSEAYFSALDFTMASITTRKYPHPTTVHLIMTKVLQGASSSLLSQKAYVVLMRILHVHPPVTSALINMYLESLLGQVKNGVSDVDPVNNHKWEFIKNVTNCSLDQTENSSTQKLNNNILLLEYLVAVLEQNFQFNIKKYQMNELNVYKLRSTMLSQILWPSMNQVCLNGRCRELLVLFEDCLTSQIDIQKKIKVVRLIVSLICMAVELCCCMEVGSAAAPGLKSLQGDRVSAFIEEIARKINACKLDIVMTRQVLSMIQPSWICLGVCCCLLNELDDYLILEGLPNSPVSLSSIVRKYFFLLPKLSCKSSISSVSYSPHKKCVTQSQRKDEINNNMTVKTPNKMEKRLANNINKRNARGETPLHIACIKNNVVQLKQILRTPGVDINVKDNAGWTPLHEACNHGNIQCVKELLNFVPAKTVDQYFSKDGEKKCRKVDLLASTDDGITPLHDAVINDRLDVCQLLLQHGGAILLKSTTALNFTPIDLANTDVMRSLLQTFQYDDHYRISSQGSESQNSQEGPDPCEFRYEQVLGFGNSQQYTDREECSKYIYMTTQLVKSYIETTHIGTIHRMIKSQKNVITEISKFKQNTSVSNDCQITGTSGHFGISGHRVTNTGVSSECVSVSDDECQHLKRDLRLLRKWSKQVKKFENHLMKISQPEDHDIIHNELLFLYSIAV